jgi:PPE family
MVELPDGPIGMFLANDEVTYNWFHNGQGSGSIDANADVWREVRDLYEDALFEVRAGLVKSGASWSGGAAEAAHGVVSPVQAWAERALDSAVVAQSTVHAQSSVFGETKTRLVPPVAVPDKPWMNDVWPGETNYDKALREKQANSARNLDLVRSYGSVTQGHTTSYPAFDEPVKVTTDVARPPVEPKDQGIVEWPTAQRRPATSSGPVQPSAGPDQHEQPSIVVGPRTPSGEQPWQPVDPSQSVPNGQASTPAGQEPGVGRTPVGGGPVAGMPGVPGAGSLEGPGGRFAGGGAAEPAPGGRPGRGGGAIEPGPGRRLGGGGIEPGPGRRLGGGGIEPGPGGRFGPGEPGAGGRPGGPGERGGPGPRGLAAAEAIAGRGGAAARGGPGGFVPGGSLGPGEEDLEHTNKFGPVQDHEDFWEEGLPLVAPQTIGGPDDE